MPEFGFVDKAAARQADTLFWCRGVALLIAALLLVPAFAFLHLLEPVAPWQEDSHWYVTNGASENPFVCQKLAAGGECEAGWELSGQRCLRLFSKEHMTFARARRRCETQDANLASIVSDQQNAEVHKVCFKHQPCWIGLLREPPSPAFFWVDGEIMEYANWHESQPDLSSNKQDAVVIGAFRGRQEAQGQLVDDHTAGVFVLTVNLGVMTLMCGLFYRAMQAKNSSCLVCTVGCDSGCALCCCISACAAFFQIAEGQSSLDRWLGFILASAQTAVSLLYTVLGLNFKATVELTPGPGQVASEMSALHGTSPPGSPQALHLGVPVQVHSPSDPVVVGRPVHAPQPQAAPSINVYPPARSGGPCSPSPREVHSNNLEGSR